MIERQPRIELKLMRQIGFADKKHVRQTVKCQIIRKIIVNIGHDLVYFFIFRDILSNSVRRGKIGAIEVNQKFQQVDCRKRAASELLLVPTVQHFFADPFQPRKHIALRPDQLVLFLARIRKASGQVRAFPRSLRQEIRMDPDHKAFIRPAFSNVRLVNIPIIREQDIPRPQLIGTDNR